MISLNALRNKCTRLCNTLISFGKTLSNCLANQAKRWKNMGSHLWFPSSPPNLNLDRPRSSAISRLHLVGSLLWSFSTSTCLVLFYGFDFALFYIARALFRHLCVRAAPVHISKFVWGERLIAYSQKWVPPQLQVFCLSMEVAFHVTQLFNSSGIST